MKVMHTHPNSIIIFILLINDPRFPKVSTKSIQKSEVLQGVIIVQDMHNPVPLRRISRPSRS